MPTILNNSTHKALTTLARQKIFLGIGSDTYDGLLTMAINQVTGFIEQYCKRNFLRQTYTNEEYDGTGEANLILKNYPVASISSFQYNQAEDNSDDWATFNTNDYFWYENGIINMRTGRLLERSQKYRVTYAAGYLIDFDNENTPASHNLPMELEYACQKLVAGIFNKRRAEGLDQSRIGDSAVVLSKTLFDDQETKAILDKYVSPTI